MEKSIYLCNNFYIFKDNALIRKRVVTAIIITALIIIITHKFWFVYEPISFDSDIKGSGFCNVEVQLNKKDDNNFNKIKKANGRFNLDIQNHINLKIIRAKRPKRLKIIITCDDNSNSLKIKNIKLNNKMISDNSKVNVEYASILKKDKELVLKLPDKKAVLTYPQTLNIKAGVKFYLGILVTIAIISYLFIYEFANLTANFSLKHKKSTADLFFLLIFFIILFIPSLHIDGSEISQFENRYLSKLEPVFDDNNEINGNFTKQFDNWFCDRFNLREKLISSYYFIQNIFTPDYQDDEHIIYNKKNQFVFNKAYGSIHTYLNDNLFTVGELNIIKNNVYDLAKYCKKNNVQLYIMLSSDKESVYGEFYPPYYKKTSEISRFLQLKNALYDIEDLELVIPLENLIKAKNEGLVFLRYDSHLNNIGSYIEYLTLLKKIKEKFPYVNYLSEDDFIKNKVSNQTGESIGYIFAIDKKKLKDERYILELKNKNAKQTSNINFGEKYNMYVYENQKSNNKLKVVIAGDSFHIKYLDYLAEDFYRVSSLFAKNGSDFKFDENIKEKLFSNRPDILIIETTERFLDRFLYLESFNNMFEENE